MMDKLIAAFPEQLLEAIEIGARAKLTAAKSPILNIVVAGMGGSGIGADFAIEFTAEERSVPMLTSKSYALPGFVNENSLVICSSFSGNTEETLYSFAEALEKGAKIVCISSGGKLIEMAKEKGLDYIQLPNNGASPRACLGYSLVQQLFVLKFFGFCSQTRIDEIKNAAELLTKDQETIRLKANKCAGFLVGRFPILYSSDRMSAVAVRLRQQLNENSKILCSHHTIPEMNHNELVGWRKQPGEFVVIMFRSKDDHPRVQARIDINKEIIGNFTNTIIEFFVKGDSLIEQAIYAVHFGDWLSWEVSLLREVDAVEVKVIDYLKSELASVNTEGESKGD